MKRTRLLLIPLLAMSFLMLGCQSYCATCDDTDSHRCVFATVLILLIVLFAVLLGIYSNILRDAVTNCDEFDFAKRIQENKQKKRMKSPRNPFSLSKVQFAMWTVVISGAYIYLVLCKCTDPNIKLEINKTALVLMGISAGTAATAAIIDKRQVDDGVRRHQNAPSQGLLIDILSDENGISVHRFQNVVWTFIAIAIYLHKICQLKNGNCSSLPELDDTLLVLTGISSATYLGLKAGENNNPEQQGNAVTLPPAPVDLPPVTTTDAATVSPADTDAGTSVPG